MQIITLQAKTVYLLAEDDTLAQCLPGSYAIIEDSGFYVAMHITESDAFAIHTHLAKSSKEAVDIIAEHLVPTV